VLREVDNSLKIRLNDYIWNMEKLYLTRLQEEIEYKAESDAQALELRNYEDIEQPYLALESERTLWHYYKLSTRHKKRSYQYANMTKHRVILMSSG